MKIGDNVEEDSLMGKKSKRKNEKHTRVEPQFNKEMPQNAWDFFAPSYDDNFEKEHPVIYGILCVIGILVLVLPNILFTIYITLVTQPEGEIFLLIGIVGAFIVGIGLFNIVAAWMKQYMGHLVTIGCFLLGGLLIVLSLMLTYDVELYAKFDSWVVQTSHSICGNHNDSSLCVVYNYE